MVMVVVNGRSGRLITHDRLINRLIGRAYMV